MTGGAAMPPEVPPAVVVHGLEQARRALAAAGTTGVTLLSAPGAAAYAGAPWFRELVAQARASHPDVRCVAALDCGAAPGHALGAIRAGIATIILDPACPAFAQVADAAAEAGAALWGRPPPALDMAELDPKRRDDAARLRAWLAIGSPREWGNGPAR